MFNPCQGTFYRFAHFFKLASYCVYQCNPRAAQKVKAILTCHYLALPLFYNSGLLIVQT